VFVATVPHEVDRGIERPAVDDDAHEIAVDELADGPAGERFW